MVVVVVITITIILSMVLEETVRAMRKKDTWDKVVQPALYARRLRNAVVCKIASAS